MNKKIAILGLGYVGLPLAHAFCKKYSVTGFDIDQTRIDELKNGVDRTLELSKEQLKELKISFTSNALELKECNFFIVTVPTPIDANKRPDLNALFGATKTIASVLKKGDIVVYESTVYPGATKECAEILEKNSNLVFNKDFFCGYSPERINPGDKEHTVTKILKVTSGSTKETAKIVDEVYKSVITAGTYLASSIEVAEAAKVIENSQRDINIAFVNELAMIFNKMNIDTKEVLKAAATKWNFLPFTPGLVGGHCIGVDPYYLTHKAQQLGHNPEVILSGRRINDQMGIYIAGQVIKLMIKKDIKINKAKVLMYGITFKENCPDVRNSKAVDVYNELLEFGCLVDVLDPWVDSADLKRQHKITSLVKTANPDDYDAIILAVAHKEFLDLKLKVSSKKIIYDIKSVLENYDERL